MQANSSTMRLAAGGDRSSLSATCSRIGPASAGQRVGRRLRRSRGVRPAPSSSKSAVASGPNVSSTHIDHVAFFELRVAEVVRAGDLLGIEDAAAPNRGCRSPTGSTRSDARRRSPATDRPASPFTTKWLWQDAQCWRNSLGPCVFGSARSIERAPVGGMPLGEPASSTARSAFDLGVGDGGQKMLRVLGLAVVVGAQRERRQHAGAQQKRERPHHVEAMTELPAADDRHQEQRQHDQARARRSRRRSAGTLRGT